MLDNDGYGCGVALLALLGISVVLVASSIANGFVLSVLWGWFVVPLFEVPSLSIAQAIGFSMTVSFLTYHYHDSGKKEEESFIKRITYLILLAIVRPIIVLTIGYIVHLFV